MLSQMQQRFTEMNDNVVTRIDDMGKKIDDLENSVGELVQEAQTEPKGPNQS